MTRAEGAQAAGVQAMGAQAETAVPAAAGATATAAPVKTFVNVWFDEVNLYQGASFKLHVSAKCQDGSAVQGRTVVVLDEQGSAAGVVRLGAPGEGQTLACGEATVTAPEQLGRHNWRVVVSPDVTHPAAEKTLRFSVVARPEREVCVRVTDVKTGTPLKDTSAFFYNTVQKGAKPLRTEGDENGVVRAGIAANVEYEVRVECPNFNEGGCTVEAGEGPVEVGIAMLSCNYNKPRLGQPGYDPF